MYVHGTFPYIFTVPVKRPFAGLTTLTAEGFVGRDGKLPACGQRQRQTASNTVRTCHTPGCPTDHHRRQPLL